MGEKVSDGDASNSALLFYVSKAILAAELKLQLVGCWPDKCDTPFNPPFQNV